MFRLFVYVLLCSSMFVASEANAAARAIKFRILLDKKVVLRGGIGDDGRDPPAVIWRRLREVRFREPESSGKGKPEHSPILKTEEKTLILRGQLLIEVSYAGEKEVAEIRLQRQETDEREPCCWVISPESYDAILAKTESRTDDDRDSPSRAADAKENVTSDHLAKHLRAIGQGMGGGNPDADMVGFIENLDIIVAANVEAVVDNHSLAAAGVSLENIALPMEMDLTHASIRASLRLILDRSGLGFFVDDENRIVITTSRIARMYWRENLHVPKIEDLSSGSVDTRRDAVFAAGYLQLDAKLWEPALVAILTDSDRSVQFDAAIALGEFGSLSDQSLDALITALNSDDASLRTAATFALGRSGPRAISKLIEQAKRSDSVAAVHSVRAIGFMGAAGNKAVDDLIAIGSSYSAANGTWNMDYCEFCEEIAQALSKIELGDAVPQLRELLKSDTSKVRAFAACSIGKIGPLAIPCEPDLQLLLKDSDVAVRINAAFALAHLNLGADTPTDALKAAALDSNRFVAIWSKEALRIIVSKQAEGVSDDLRK